MINTLTCGSMKHTTYTLELLLDFFINSHIISLMYSFFHRNSFQNAMIFSCFWMTYFIFLLQNQLCSDFKNKYCIKTFLCLEDLFVAPIVGEISFINYFLFMQTLKWRLAKARKNHVKFWLNKVWAFVQLPFSFQLSWKIVEKA